LTTGGYNVGVAYELVHNTILNPSNLTFEAQALAREFPSEAYTMKKFLKHRFPDFIVNSDIIVEEDSQTTIENAVFGKTLFDRLGEEVYNRSKMRIGLITK